MADQDLLRHARCLHHSPERVQDERFLQQSEFFDPKDIVQVKYELLRSCQVEHADVLSACHRFGFSRTTYYKLYDVFLQGGIPALVGRPRGRRKPSKLDEYALGYIIAEKSRDPKLPAWEMVERLQSRHHVTLSARIIQLVWRRYGLQKKTQQ